MLVPCCRHRDSAAQRVASDIADENFPSKGRSHRCHVTRDKQYPIRETANYVCVGNVRERGSERRRLPLGATPEAALGDALGLRAPLRAPLGTAPYCSPPPSCKASPHVAAISSKLITLQRLLILSSRAARLGKQRRPRLARLGSLPSYAARLRSARSAVHGRKRRLGAGGPQAHLTFIRQRLLHLAQPDSSARRLARRPDILRCGPVATPTRPAPPAHSATLLSALPATAIVLASASPFLSIMAPSLSHPPRPCLCGAMRYRALPAASCTLQPAIMPTYRSHPRLRGLLRYRVVLTHA